MSRTDTNDCSMELIAKLAELKNLVLAMQATLEVPDGAGLESTLERHVYPAQAVAELAAEWIQDLIGQIDELSSGRGC